MKKSAEPSVYAGIFVINTEKWTVLATSDSHYPHERKAPGGMMKSGDVTIRSAAHRESMEECQTQVLKSTLVLVESPLGNKDHHVRYFFLADEFSNTLDPGAVWNVEEKNPEGKVVEKLTTQWIPLADFVRKLYHKQYPAFGAVLGLLGRRHPELLASQRFCHLLARFPEPKNLGIDGVNVD
jgi:ADP-ribose pyrophosphatase YjhB (NUDIX family)